MKRDSHDYSGETVRWFRIPDLYLEYGLDYAGEMKMDEREKENARIF